MKANFRHFIVREMRWTCVMLIATTSVSSVVADQICVNDDGEGPEICLDFSLGEPEPDNDFELDFSDDDKPSIELRTASTTWRVWSVADGGGAGAIGTLKCKADATGSFGVKLFRPGDTYPGAVTIEEIIFVSTNSGMGAEIVSGYLTSHLNGDLTLQENSGGTYGGKASSFYIGGDVLGSITLVEGAGLTIGGTFGLSSCTIGTTCPDLTIETIDGGALTINDVLKARIFVNDTIKGTGGKWDIQNGVASQAQVTIASMVSPGKLVVGSGITAGTDNFGGSLILNTDLPSGCELDFSHVVLDGSVSLFGGGGFKDCNGTIKVYDVPSAGDIFADDLGVTGSIQVTDDIDGTLHFYTAAADGSSITVGDDVTGSVIIDNGAFAGMLDVDGDLGGTFRIDGNLTVDGEVIVAGSITGTVDINGNCAGQILVATDVSSGGVIDIGGNVTGTIDIDADCDGDILVGGSVSSGGTINIDGNLTNDIVVSNDVDGYGIVIDLNAASTATVQIGGDLDNQLWIKGALAGGVTINGSANGDITVDGDFASTSTIDIGVDLVGDVSFGADLDGDLLVGGNVSSACTIAVDGEAGATGLVEILGDLNGDLLIDEQTVAGSFIKANGIDSSGSIVTNYAGSTYNANGDIRIGLGAKTDSILFDGFIRVANSLSGGGDLNGDITVVGCHATDDDLTICVCGNTNGSIVISQSGFCEQVEVTDVCFCY